MSYRSLFNPTLLKLCLVVATALVWASACLDKGSSKFVIADSKSYEASLFRQRCSICHGSEGNGRTLDDGRQVPSLRSGEFKFKTEDEIYNQITNGGNGMTPFREQLTERERRMLAVFVHDQLRPN